MQKLKYYREKAGFTRSELGTYIKKRGSFISNLENGKTDPTMRTIIQLCAALLITPNQLLDYNEPRQMQLI